MAQILVRNLKPEVVARLKRRAKKGSRSLQSEVKAILEHAAQEGKVDPTAALEMVDRFRARFKGRKFSDSAELIREDRDR
jgi:plasmid stability protein